MEASACVVVTGLPVDAGPGPPRGVPIQVGDGASLFAGLVALAAESRQMLSSAPAAELPESPAVEHGESVIGSDLAATVAALVTAPVLGESGTAPAVEQQSAGQGNPAVGQLVSVLQRQRPMDVEEREALGRKARKEMFRGSEPDAQHPEEGGESGAVQGKASVRTDKPAVGIGMTPMAVLTDKADKVLSDGDGTEADSGRQRDAALRLDGLLQENHAIQASGLTLRSVEIPPAREVGSSVQTPDSGSVALAPPHVGTVMVPSASSRAETAGLPGGQPVPVEPVLVVDDSEARGVPAAGRHSPPGATPVRDQFDLPDQSPASVYPDEVVMRQVPSGVTVVNPGQTSRHAAGLLHDAAVHVLDEQVIMGRLGREQRPELEPVRQQGEAASVVVGDSPEVTEGMSGFNQSGSGNNPQGSAQNPGAEVLVNGTAGERVAATDTHSLESLKSRFQESIINQVRERLAAYEPASSNNRITLKLNPGELGELHIQVQMRDQRMNVEIMAQNPAVKEVLLQNMDQLKESLARQNIVMERFDVSSDPGQGGEFSRFFREGRQAAGQQYDGRLYSPPGYMTDEQSPGPVVYGDGQAASLVDMRF